MSKREKYNMRSISELEQGEKIKHPVHGVLVFIDKDGTHGVFRDENNDEVRIMELGQQYKKV